MSVIQFSPFYSPVQKGSGFIKDVKDGIKSLRKSKVISKTLGQLSKLANVADVAGVPLAGSVSGLAKKGAKTSSKVGFGKAKRGKGKKKH